MAKVSARGHHEVLKVELVKPPTADGYVYRYLFVLRSDGNVLRRLAGYRHTTDTAWGGGGGYAILGKIKPNKEPFDLEAYVARRYAGEVKKVR